VSLLLRNCPRQMFKVVPQVLFNAPGTLVTSNTIVTKTRLGLGAINMVDPGVCQCLTRDHDKEFSHLSVSQMMEITRSPESLIIQS
jgi:hypothetical protein